MQTGFITYSCEGITFKGFLANSESKQKKPAILVVHAWKGQDDIARQKAQELAKLGYFAFAVDMYGEGLNAHSDEEAFKLMLPLFLDRGLVRRRILAAYETIKNHPHVNSNAIGAIGFCFGGMVVIELLRSGADVKGVASFHGQLGYKLGDHVASHLPASKQIKGALLILHGYDDPSIPMQDVNSIQKEFNEANVDWQMHTYGHAMHAFTNPHENDPKNGKCYDEKATMRSWQAMSNFFEELLQIITDS